MKRYCTNTDVYALLIGVLGKCIHVYGDWLPRNLFGKFTAFFAIVRMIFLAFIVGFFYRSQSDLVFLDGVSAPVPILRLFGLRVLFYCHFPDKVCINARLISCLHTMLYSYCVWTEAI